MSKNRAVLGRGLGALLSGIPAEVEQHDANVPQDDGRSVGTVCTIDVTKVRQNPFQPRLDFDRKALEELAQSIKENGVIQPITVRRVEEGFELISGERRVQASIIAGLAMIPAYILNVESDRAMLELALIENVQRENLNPIEVALGYQRLIKECRLTQEEVALKIGKDRTTVTNFLRLLRLNDQIRTSLRRSEISMGHARALLAIADEEAQSAVWRRVVDDALSVRRTEELVRQTLREEERDVVGKGEKSAPEGAKAEGVHTKLNAMYEEIAGRLRQVLGTQVKIRRNGKDGAGALVVDFYSDGDLERLLELFAVIERHQ